MSDHQVGHVFESTESLQKTNIRLLQTVCKTTNERLVTHWAIGYNLKRSALECILQETRLTLP
jgi:hypothetical protein